MKLLRAPEYQVRLLPALSSTETPQSEILRAGQATGKVVDGAVLEVMLRWNDHLLLFLTGDTPFEESLHIHLLNTNLDVIDSVWMGHMYSSGIFSDLDLALHDAVRFQFFGGTVWTLTLFPEDKFAVPFFSDPIGEHRALKFFRRFKLISTDLE